MTTTRTTAILVTLVAGALGCAALPHPRAVVEGERLQLPSLTTSALPGAGWYVLRDLDAGGSQLVLYRVAPDRRWVIGEWKGPVPPDAFPFELGQASAARVRELVGDPMATVTELRWLPETRLGASAELVAFRAEESAGRARLLVKQVAVTAKLTFRSSEDPERTCSVRYEERGPADELTMEHVEARWREGVQAIEPRAATPANVASAARADDFPKQFSPGLARRSLTLQGGSVRLGYHGSRRVEAGSWRDQGELRIGLTDHWELAAPGFFQYSFGQVAALTAPEYSIGAGLTRYDHGATLGSVWGAGLGASARRRFGSDAAWQVGALGEVAHESRTGRTTYGGQAYAGLIWDVDRLLSLGLEVGGAERPASHREPSAVWIGGLATPLATFHVPVVNLDLGFRGALTVDHGAPGFIVGLMSAITL